MRKVIVHGAWLVAAAVSVAGCTSAAATSAGGSSTLSSSAGVQPSGANAAAATELAAPTAVASGGQYPTASPSSAAATSPLDLLPIPTDANAWTTNTDGLMGLDAYIDQVYDPDSQSSEKSLYTRRGFVSGAFEGWFNADGSQQTIAIARFAGASGATSAFDDLSNSLREKPAPSGAFTDSADDAVGLQDPTVNSEGDASVDITARVGDYLVDVHEFSAATPDASAAKALLLKQVGALKG